MITKSGKHHYQYGYTKYDKKTGEVIWNTDKTVAVSNDFESYMQRSKERNDRHGVRIEYRNIIDLDA